MKILEYLKNNILLIITLFLLAFIPLYPKLPLFGVTHTWVYIRLEDFLVALALLVWGVQFLRKKAALKTPLTIPFVIFWGVGLVSTLFAVIFLFPHLSNVFPNVAILSYIRQIEYLSVFFVAFSAIRNKKSIPIITAVITGTLLIVALYGFGQRGIIVGQANKFPAFLTMNEEFAKGIPLILSNAARIPSTFAGHYDLAAYLILVIPIIGSMIFGFKNIFTKILLLSTATLGVVLLLMTASRVSFVVYLAAVSFMLLLQKKKLLIIPVIILSIFLLRTSQATSQRFSQTISQVDLVVDARTGKAIGIAKQVHVTTKKAAPKKVVIEDIQSTGENLPQGSGYINLPSTGITKTITEVSYKRSLIKAGTTSAEVTNIQGDFAVKKVLAYDVSFTTRFQGEWPRAIDAFKRNMLLGSGYSSISLASDNNYLRILGETGALGFASFLLIFMVMGVYVYRVLPEVVLKAPRSMIIGVVSGIFGLGLNAILIDVFEASKVAFEMWLLIGIMMGLLALYHTKPIHYIQDLKKIVLSLPAIATYLLLADFALFTRMINNYFVADDFTWLRWVADCKKVLYSDMSMRCEPVKTTITNYFLHSEGFFYRPLMKLYYFILYAMFWLNQGPYHVMSIIINFVALLSIYILSEKILKSKLFGFITAILFLVLSSHSETIYWISSSGHLLGSVSILLSLVFYLYWKEKKQIWFLALSLLFTAIAPFFHEFAVVAPIMVIAFDIVYFGWGEIKTKWYYLLYVSPLVIYFALKIYTKSLWSTGDYSYNLKHLPYNLVGNAIGYFLLGTIGNVFLPLYDKTRMYGKENTGVVAVAIFGVIIAGTLAYYFGKKRLERNFKLFALCFLFFIIPLLPFLPLGNIAIRYIYLGSFGIVLLFGVILQKIFAALKKMHYSVAYLVVFGIVIVFSVIHISQLNKSDNDWKTAGNITNNLLINFNDTYGKAPLINPVFYFVNVPVRTGEAWIFPVGINDAMWFTFQNENLNIQTPKTLDLALDAAEGSSSARVFEFDKDGNVEQIVRTKKTTTIKVNGK